MKCSRCKRRGLPERGKKKFCPPCVEHLIVHKVEAMLMVPDSIKRRGKSEIQQFINRMLKDLRKNSVEYTPGEPHVVSEPIEDDPQQHDQQAADAG